MAACQPTCANRLVPGLCCCSVWCAEHLFLAFADSFLLSWQETAAAIGVAGDGPLAARLQQDPRLLLLAVLSRAEQRARSSVAGPLVGAPGSERLSVRSAATVSTSASELL